MTILVPNPTTAMMLIEARVLAINAMSSPTANPVTRMSMEELSINFVHQKTVDKLKTFWATTSGFIGRLFTNTPNVLADSLDLTTAIRVATNNVYLNDKDIKLICPVGLNTDYVSYLAILETMADTSIDFYDNTLVPFKTWVGEVLNTPAKIEQVRTQARIEAFLPEELLKQHAKCFKGKESTAKYGVLLSRNSDWSTIQDTTNRILTKMTGVHSPVMVNETVKRLDESIGALLEALTDPQKTYRASPRNIEALSMLCYNLAKMIEFYGLVCYSIQTAAVAIKEDASHYVNLRK